MCPASGVDPTEPVVTAAKRLAVGDRFAHALAGLLLAPFALWGRLRVAGLDCMPPCGPVLVVPNHDSQWDPPLVLFALRGRRRVRFLARANLWDLPLGATVLDALSQIPVERGARDESAIAASVDALRRGEAVCIFVEGTISRGERLRARGGVGRLAAACPGAAIVLCAVRGTTDYVRFPRRPRVTVTFFEPRDGGRRPAEDAGTLAARLLEEVRERVPPVASGRRAAAVAT